MSWLIKFLLTLGSLVMSFYPGQRAVQATGVEPQQAHAQVAAVSAAQPARSDEVKAGSPRICSAKKTDSRPQRFAAVRAVNLAAYASDLDAEHLSRAAQADRSSLIASVAQERGDLLKLCARVRGCDVRELHLAPPVRVRVQMPTVDLAELKQTAEVARELARSAELRRLERASFPVETLP